MSTEEEAAAAPRLQHPKQAWAHWEALGAPKFIVAPMVDQVRNI
jgi:hypothetical protein